LQDGTEGATADGLSVPVDSSQAQPVVTDESMKRSLLVDASDDAASLDVKRARYEADTL